MLYSIPLSCHLSKSLLKTHFISLKNICQIGLWATLFSQKPKNVIFLAFPCMAHQPHQIFYQFNYYHRTYSNFSKNAKKWLKNCCLFCLNVIWGHIFSVGVWITSQQHEPTTRQEVAIHKLIYSIPRSGIRFQFWSGRGFHSRARKNAFIL